MSEPIFFAGEAEWRAWLDRHHATASEVIVGIYKKGAARDGLTHREMIDGALAYGWIDGRLNSLGETAYKIRVTPRRKGSIWSAVNIKRVGELRAAGRMNPAGIAVFEGRDLGRAGLYTHEQGELAMPANYQRRLEADKAAHAFFEEQPRSYRRVCIWWVSSAKQEATRERRLTQRIGESAAGRRLAQFVSPVAKHKQRKG